MKNIKIDSIILIVFVLLIIGSAIYEFYYDMPNYIYFLLLIFIMFLGSAYRYFKRKRSIK